jgi:hypothetical protein
VSLIRSKIYALVKIFSFHAAVAMACAKIGKIGVHSFGQAEVPRFIAKPIIPKIGIRQKVDDALAFDQQVFARARRIRSGLRSACHNLSQNAPVDSVDKVVNGCWNRIKTERGAQISFKESCPFR